MERPSEFYDLNLLVVVEDCVECDSDGQWVDFYFDVSTIVGWYIPLDLITGKPSTTAINVLIPGDELTIRQNKRIKNYLLKYCYVHSSA